MNKLPPEFYLNTDVIAISRALLGKYLVTQIEGAPKTVGKIVETEAYKAPEDKASHAYNHRRTPRTELMFQAGGIAYVYLCYGIHHLFNVVTGPTDTPHAVLIRAIEPIDGIDTMISRRNHHKVSKKLTAGPGILSAALGITTQLNGTTLNSDTLWIEDRGETYSPQMIQAKPRIGIAYAKEYANKPWRFFIKNNPWISVP